MSASATGLAAATLALAIPTQASAASGGGCTWDITHSIEACISASGSYLLPDMYVTALPDGPCEGIVIALTSQEQGVIWHTGIPCRKGHYPEASPWKIPGTPGDVYTTYVDYYAPNFHDQTLSPEEHY